MKQLRVKKSGLSGSLIAPPSKSQTLRAILFASLAKGQSQINNILNSPDTVSMITACRLLGAGIIEEQNNLKITGVAGQPKCPNDIINAGNSGQVLRFIGAIAGLIDGYTVLTGDESVRTRRPIEPLINGLSQLGADCISTQNNHHPPIIIKGPMKANKITIAGADSQPVSGLLIASSFLSGTTELNINNPGELPWIGVTLDWFDRLGIKYQNQNFKQYIIQGGFIPKGFDYTVPGDFSSIAYPIIAALISQSKIVIKNINMNDAQGDKALIEVLLGMGAKIEVKPSELIVYPSGVLKG